jgi:hypothetical protein
MKRTETSTPIIVKTPRETQQQTVEKTVENLVDLHATGMVQRCGWRFCHRQKIPTSRKKREKWGTL